MDIDRLERMDETRWRIPRRGAMRVPGVLHGSEALVRQMDEQVARQLSNVCRLPGVVEAAHAMPDAHWGYGFPIGGVAAFDPDEGGVVSAGGVGFDIACGVRAHLTGLTRADLKGHEERLAQELARRIPAGVGSRGDVAMDARRMRRMLEGGARWAVDEGFGRAGDLARVEEAGRMAGADPAAVSDKAKARQTPEMGTLGSGNHYLEVQVVDQIYDPATAARFGLARDGLIVSIHCGSRGLGHQIGTDYLKEMTREAARVGLKLPERELASAPAASAVGRAYLGAMRAAINCALANRQILGHLLREAFDVVIPGLALPLLYDVSHNTCKEERHEVGGRPRRLLVHRKGATRSLGPGHPDLPADLKDVGQPVLIGGTMGTASYVLVGAPGAAARAFSSAVHGAGRAMSRKQAKKRWDGRALVKELAREGVIIKGASLRGVAEEAPGAYKPVDEVVEAAHRADLARKVARLRPLIVIKG
jgi:tRNA-splicing ligase RtcB (3'-phosphate/5'-hydroxy nucleic acid ligase)